MSFALAAPAPDAARHPARRRAVPARAAPPGAVRSHASRTSTCSPPSSAARARGAAGSPPPLFLLALAALCVGVARPQVTKLVPSQQATVILVVDISGSMQATDVKPSRLARGTAGGEGLPRPRAEGAARRVDRVRRRSRRGRPADDRPRPRPPGRRFARPAPRLPRDGDRRRALGGREARPAGGRADEARRAARPSPSTRAARSRRRRSSCSPTGTRRGATTSRSTAPRSQGRRHPRVHGRARHAERRPRLQPPRRRRRRRSGLRGTARASAGSAAASRCRPIPRRCTRSRRSRAGSSSRPGTRRRSTLRTRRLGSRLGRKPGKSEITNELVLVGAPAAARCARALSALVAADALTNEAPARRGADRRPERPGQRSAGQPR